MGRTYLQTKRLRETLRDGFQSFKLSRNARKIYSIYRIQRLHQKGRQLMKIFYSYSMDTNLETRITFDEINIPGVIVKPSHGYSIMYTLHLGYILNSKDPPKMRDAEEQVKELIKYHGGK